MARPLVLRVIAAPLNHAHLVDLLEGYEQSGFFRGADYRTPILNDRAKESTRTIWQPTEVFAEGPLKGRPINSVSTRMQTYAIAPRFVLFDGAEDRLDDDCIDHPAFELEGKPLIISGLIRDVLFDAYEKCGLDDEALDRFLSKHQGMPAAIVTK